MNFVYLTVNLINKVILMRSAKHLASLVKKEPECDERWVAAQQWRLTHQCTQACDSKGSLGFKSQCELWLELSLCGTCSEV